MTSNPPKYKAFCEKCDKVIYTLCSDAYGKVSMNQENNITDYHNDIHRIADALEKIAKIFEPSKIVVNEMTDEEKEKLLKSLKEQPLTITSPYIIPNTLSSCENCWWYQYQKSNPNPTITAGDTPCTWCQKMQPTCVSSNKTE